MLEATLLIRPSPIGSLEAFPGSLISKARRARVRMRYYPIRYGTVSRVAAEPGQHYWPTLDRRGLGWSTRDGAEVQPTLIQRSQDRALLRSPPCKGVNRPFNCGLLSTLFLKPFGKVVALGPTEQVGVAQTGRARLVDLWPARSSGPISYHLVSMRSVAVAGVMFLSEVASAS